MGFSQCPYKNADRFFQIASPILLLASRLAQFPEIVQSNGQIGMLGPKFVPLHLYGSFVEGFSPFVLLNRVACRSQIVQYESNFSVASAIHRSVGSQGGNVESSRFAEFVHSVKDCCKSYLVRCQYQTPWPFHLASITDSSPRITLATSVSELRMFETAKIVIETSANRVSFKRGKLRTVPERQSIPAKSRRIIPNVLIVDSELVPERETIGNRHAAPRRDANGFSQDYDCLSVVTEVRARPRIVLKRFQFRADGLALGAD